MAQCRAAREDETANLLGDGTVLVAGGIGSTGHSVASADLYDPATDSFTSTAGPMTVARADQQAVTLLDGTVLLIGGVNSSGNTISTAELYDPTSRSFHQTTGSLLHARALFTANLLASGQVLLAGGLGSSSVLNSAELFDPASQTFSAAADLNSPRMEQFAGPLPDGRVLIGGGFEAIFMDTLGHRRVLPAAGGHAGQLCRHQRRACIYHAATVLP